MNTIYHYMHICSAVLTDFQTFGVSVRNSVFLYVRATHEVAIELWDEFAPKTLTEYTSLPSFPSLSSFLAYEYEIEESPRLLLFLLVAIPFVIFLGTLWFLCMLIFLGA